MSPAGFGQVDGPSVCASHPPGARRVRRRRGRFLGNCPQIARKLAAAFEVALVLDPAVHEEVELLLVLRVHPEEIIALLPLQPGWLLVETGTAFLPTTTMRRQRLPASSRPNRLTNSSSSRRHHSRVPSSWTGSPAAATPWSERRRDGARTGRRARCAWCPATGRDGRRRSASARSAAGHEDA